MDKNILSGLGAGPGCNYPEPDLVFEKACADHACRAQVRRHLPGCKSRSSSQMKTSIRHGNGIARAPLLTLAVMDKLTDCIAEASDSPFDRGSVDYSDFREVRKDVRSDTAKAAGAGVYLYPVVGQTTFLYGPA